LPVERVDHTGRRVALFPLTVNEKWARSLHEDALWDRQ
jgi:hypothetical protein